MRHIVHLFNDLQFFLIHYFKLLSRLRQRFPVFSVIHAPFQINPVFAAVFFVAQTGLPALQLGDELHSSQTFVIIVRLVLKRIKLSARLILKVHSKFKDFLKLIIDE